MQIDFENDSLGNLSRKLKFLENDLKKLKEYIEKYSEIATEYMKELNLI